MPQARGSQLAVNIYEETEYGVPPDPATGKRVYPKGCSLSSSQALLADDTLDPTRGKPQPDKGNIDAGGGLPFNLAAEDLGTLFKHAFGVATTYRPVVTQPVNITGVTVVRAEKTCTVGDGTLAFTATGTTLSWTANGDTAGAAVDVSAGGSFTLQSGTAGEALYVVVTTASLPGADQSDTITVVDAYEHELTPGDLPVGLTIERDYGANITGVGRFEQFHGCRVGSMRLAFPQNGYATAEFDFKGASSTLAAGALDGTPEDNGHKSFTTFYVTTMEEGGAAIASVTEWNASLENGLDETGYALGTGSRSEMPEGMASVGGNLTAMFRDTTLLNKAISGTTSSLRSVLKRGTGDGTAGNEYIETQITDLIYERKSPEVSGPAGVRIQLAFRGFKSGANLGMKMIIRNNVAEV